MPQRGATFGQDYPALEQHCAQLIDQPGPRRDESLACPVQHLQIELLLALERHEAHRRSCRASAIASASRSSVFCDFT